MQELKIKFKYFGAILRCESLCVCGIFNFVFQCYYPHPQYIQCEINETFLDTEQHDYDFDTNDISSTRTKDRQIADKESENELSSSKFRFKYQEL